MLTAGTKSENVLSEVEDSTEGGEIKEAEVTESVLESNGNDSGLKQEAEKYANGSETSQKTFSYEQLKAHSVDPVTGIDFKRREVG